MDSGRMFAWALALILVGFEISITGFLMPAKLRWWTLSLWVAEATLLPVMAWLLELIPYALARRNLFWTMIPEGASKQIMYKDKFKKSILSKRGYGLDENWNVVPLPAGEKEQESGLFWIGIWPFNQVYKRIMKFTKALPDATYKERADPDTDFLLTGTDYQYALVFEGCEDREKLPLSGHMTMTAKITNPYKALFLVKEWFDAMVNRVLPRVREYISEHSYDELINSPDVKLDTEVWKMLNEDSPGTPSIRTILKEEYGIEIVALETVNISPPDDYREATLRQFLAVQNARAEAEETGGALDKMIDARIDRLALRLGLVGARGEIDYKQVRAHLKGNPQILERIEKDQLDLLRRDRAKGGLRDIRVANADGSSMNSATGTLVALIDLFRGQGGAPGTGTSGQAQTTNQSSDAGGKKRRRAPWNQGIDNPKPDPGSNPKS